MTLSGGVTCWAPGSSWTVPDLLHQADEALFQAKTSGRSRVHMAPAHLRDAVDRRVIGL